MFGNDKTVNPGDYPSEKDAEDLVDRGDNGIEDEEEQEEEQEEESKSKKAPAKKSAKSKEKEEDPEDEEEDDEEEDDEEEDDEEEDEEPAGKTVPLHVLQKAQRKRRDAETKVQALEDRLRALEGDKSERQKGEFEKLEKRMDELYEKVEEARAEGKSAEAAKLQRELDGIRNKMSSAQVAMLATRQALQQSSLMAYNALVNELEMVDPRFDKDEDEYDEDLVDRVDEVTQAYEARGLSAPDALRKALGLVLGKDPFREARRLSREDKKKGLAEEKPKPRKTDVKKNLETKKKQPPEDKEGVKERQGKVNVATLSDEDFEKLPKSKLRELRGDFG